MRREDGKPRKKVQGERRLKEPPLLHKIRNQASILDGRDQQRTSPKLNARPEIEGVGIKTKRSVEAGKQRILNGTKRRRRGKKMVAVRQTRGNTYTKSRCGERRRKKMISYARQEAQ